jgi:hypothetical protein
LSKLPLPRPPASTWALMTMSSVPICLATASASAAVDALAPLGRSMPYYLHCRPVRVSESVLLISSLSVLDKRANCVSPGGGGRRNGTRGCSGLAVVVARGWGVWRRGKPAGGRDANRSALAKTRKSAADDTEQRRAAGRRDSNLGRGKGRRQCAAATESEHCGWGLELGKETRKRGERLVMMSPKKDCGVVAVGGGVGGGGRPRSLLEMTLTKTDRPTQGRCFVSRLAGLRQVGGAGCCKKNGSRDDPSQWPRRARGFYHPLAELPDKSALGVGANRACHFQPCHSAHSAHSRNQQRANCRSWRRTRHRMDLDFVVKQEAPLRPCRPDPNGAVPPSAAPRHRGNFGVALSLASTFLEAIFHLSPTRPAWDFLSALSAPATSSSGPATDGIHSTSTCCPELRLVTSQRSRPRYGFLRFHSPVSKLKGPKMQWRVNISRNLASAWAVDTRSRIPSIPGLGLTLRRREPPPPFSTSLQDLRDPYALGCDGVTEIESHYPVFSNQWPQPDQDRSTSDPHMSRRRA